MGRERERDTCHGKAMTDWSVRRELSSKAKERTNHLLDATTVGSQDLTDRDDSLGVLVEIDAVIGIHEMER
jgi:hypothetical protein